MIGSHKLASTEAKLTPSGDSVHTRLQKPRRRYRGLRWGIAFCGWCAATGLALLLLAAFGGASVALGISNGQTLDLPKHASTAAFVVGISFVVIVALAYYVGGYVAGRMARFDGARQGLGLWIWGVCTTALAGAATAVVAINLNGPPVVDTSNLPWGRTQLAVAAAIALGATAVATLFTAIAGAKLGERKHRKIDQDILKFEGEA
jgi:hypothetical protein